MSRVKCRIERSRAVLRTPGACVTADLHLGTFELVCGSRCIIPRAAAGVTLVSGERPRTDAMAHHRAEVVGDGRALEVVHGFEGTGPVLVQRFSADQRTGGILYDLWLRARETPVAVECLHHLLVECVKGDPSAFEPGAGLWMWRHGTVSPGDPVLFLPLDSPDIPETHDRYRWLIEEEGRVGFSSEMLAVFRSSASGRTCLLGFATVVDQACGFTVMRGKDVFDRVDLESRCDLEGLGAAAGEEIRAETLLILPEVDPWDAVERYAKHLKERYGPVVPPGPLVGWSDWQYYRRKVTEQDVLENLETLAAEKYPIEYVLVDDGYQRNISDWLVPNERFPHGIQWLAERIREKGFKPGIWIAPLTAHESSEIVRQHPDWLLSDRSGGRVANRTHMGTVHVIDYTVPEAADWLRSLIRTLVREYGFRWIKLDGPIRGYYAHGVFRNRRQTSVQHIRMVLQIIREEAAGAVVEGEGYYGPSIGLVDTQRVTQDIQQDWPRLKHTAQVNLLSTFWHRRLWINNPDAFILRDEPAPACDFDGKPEVVMTSDELQTEVTALALSGGVVMLTDRMRHLKEERKSLVDAFIPVCQEPARPVDLFNGKFCPEVFHQKVHTDVETYDVIAVFNWDDTPRRAVVDLARAGLEAAKQRVAFEYWTQTFLGTVDRSLDLGEIPAHGVRLAAVRPRLEHPFVMGTSLHLTQGGVGLDGLDWDAERLCLSFRITSWKKRTGSVRIYVPHGYEPVRAQCSSTLLRYGPVGADSAIAASAATAGPEQAEVVFEAGGTVEISLAFRHT